jgi:hypothetical protein
LPVAQLRLKENHAASLADALTKYVGTFDFLYQDNSVVGVRLL